MKKDKERSSRKRKNKLKKLMNIAIQHMRMSMMKILDHQTEMTRTKRLNLLFTLNMKKKYKMSKTNKGWHQEEGSQLNIIFNLQILVDHLQELKVEVCDFNIQVLMYGLLHYSCIKFLRSSTLSNVYSRDCCILLLMTMSSLRQLLEYVLLFYILFLVKGRVSFVYVFLVNYALRRSHPQVLSLFLNTT